jgi:hypothetical protein
LSQINLSVAAFVYQREGDIACIGVAIVAYVNVRPIERWLEADTVDALALQRPLPDDALRIVAKGEKEDRSPEFAP